MLKKRGPRMEPWDTLIFFHAKWNWHMSKNICRSSPSEIFLGKRVLKICSKFTGEHPCRSRISIKLHCNFTEIALQHGCSSVNLLYIFRTSFYKNTSGSFWIATRTAVSKILCSSRSSYPDVFCSCRCDHVTKVW